jgi:ubiquinone/menaquinone biosynthesis C-methylase UbiE
MTGAHRMPFENRHKLDAPERKAFQPSGPLVDLVARQSPRLLLDLGAGTGYFTIPLADRLPAARIAALDVEPRMLTELRANAEQAGVAERIRTVPAGAEEIPLGTRSMDVVLLANLYHELEDRAATLAEVKRVLAPGGMIVICDWDPSGPGEAGPPRDHRIDAETVRADLEGAGFRTVVAHDIYRDLYLLAAGV